MVFRTIKQTINYLQYCIENPCTSEYSETFKENLKEKIKGEPKFMKENSITFVDKRANVKISYDNIRELKFYPKGIKIIDTNRWATFVNYNDFDELNVEVYEVE